MPLIPEKLASRQDVKSAIACQFWEQPSHSTRSIDGQAWSLPCEPPALNLTGSSGLSRTQQLVAAQALGVPAFPSYDAHSEGLVFDRVITKLGGKRWWTAIAGRVKAQRMWRLAAAQEGRSKLSILRDLDNYGVVARGRYQLGRRLTLNGIVESPSVTLLHSHARRHVAAAVDKLRHRLSPQQPAAGDSAEAGAAAADAGMPNEAVGPAGASADGPGRPGSPGLPAAPTVPTASPHSLLTPGSAGRPPRPRRPAQRPEEGEVCRAHGSLRYSLPGHDLTATLGYNQDYVDSSGEYAHVPLAASLDLASQYRPDGLQYRVGLHQVTAPAVEGSIKASQRLRTTLHIQGAVAVEGEAHIWKPAPPSSSAGAAGAQPAPAAAGGAAAAPAAAQGSAAAPAGAATAAPGAGSSEPPAGEGGAGPGEPQPAAAKSRLATALESAEQADAGEGSGPRRMRRERRRRKKEAAAAEGQPAASDPPAVQGEGGGEQQPQQVVPEEEGQAAERHEDHPHHGHHHHHHHRRHHHHHHHHHHPHHKTSHAGGEQGDEGAAEAAGTAGGPHAPPEAAAPTSTHSTGAAGGVPHVGSTGSSSQGRAPAEETGRGSQEAARGGRGASQGAGPRAGGEEHPTSSSPLESFIKPLGDLLHTVTHPNEGGGGSEQRGAAAQGAEEPAQPQPQRILGISAKTIQEGIRESLALLEQVRASVAELTSNVQEGSLQRLSQQLADSSGRGESPRRRPYSLFLAQPHLKINGSMGCLARMPLPPLRGLGLPGPFPLSGAPRPRGPAAGGGSSASLSSMASTSTAARLAEAWEPYLKGTSLRLFASGGISGQLGRFTRPFLDYTAASLRVDVGLTSPHVVGLLPDPASLDASDTHRPDKHRAFALEGRGSWHSLSASLAQQVVGPVRARADFRFALDPTNMPQNAGERSTIKGLVQTALSVRPSLLEAVFGFDVVLPGTEGAARLACWWSPHRKEAMAELRLF